MTSRRRRAHRRRARRRMIIKMIPVMIILLGFLAGAIIFATSGALEDLSYSSKKEDLSTYFGESSDIEAIVVKDGVYTDERVSLIDGNPYMNYDTVKSEYINRFYKEESTDSILYTNATETIKTVIGTNTYGITGTENVLNIPATMVRGETLYVSLEYIGLFTTLDYSIYGGNDGTPYRIEVRKASDTVDTIRLKDDKAIRSGTSKKSPIVTKPGKDSVLRVLNPAEGEMVDEGWKKVMTEDLIIGYIEDKHLTSPSQMQIAVNEIPEISIPQQSLGVPVAMGWSMIAGVAGNDIISGQIDSAPGMNVISPTWFYLNDNEGTVASIASKNVVNYAHSKGIQVWAMFDNFTNSEIKTSYALSDASRRGNIINQLMSYAKDLSLDGINVDFESLSEDAGEPFIQFIRELSVECHKNNIVLSVDNYVPTVSSKIYNRKEQGIFADYVIIMGYDEHYRGSEEAGSVASIGFVTDGIDKTLAEVPKERVINAVPFYTRMWRVQNKTDDELAVAPTSKDGELITYNITEVQNLSMQQAIDTVAEHSDATKFWDDTVKQTYAEWPSTNGKTMIWLEDAESLDAKLKVMSERNLAGVAAWALGYSEPFAWNVINNYY